MADLIANPEAYFKDLLPASDALLRALEDEAEREKIPIVGPLVGQLLQILVAATNAREILELGTATGYSTLFLGRGSSRVNGRILTIEHDQQRASRAQAHFESAGLDGRIDIRVGDALRCLSDLNGSYDFVFIDIEKKDYGRALPDLERLIRPGGMLVADNVAFVDADAFNRAIAGSSLWQAVALYGFLPNHSPEYDGLTIALKTGA